jgi:magnesium-transporting ATPase (P-type)
MLTGDKGDTAHQIAFSCGLYSHESDFKVFKVEEKGGDALVDQLSGLKSEAKYGVTISATNLVDIMTDRGNPERAKKMLKIID